MTIATQQRRHPQRGLGIVPSSSSPPSFRRWLPLLLLLASVAVPVPTARAWTVRSTPAAARGTAAAAATTSAPPPRLFATVSGGGGNLHGQGSCFLPLKQLTQDYYAPRIVQIAGSYPGLTRAEYDAVRSEPSPDPGQWTYDFSDPDGPQLGTVAVEGSEQVHACRDPVVVIAEHTSLNIPLPDELTEPVDVVVLLDRARTHFQERKFLALDVGGDVSIGAYQAKEELPPDCEIVGHVVLTQIPWLPCMRPTKTGFMEEDEW